VNRPKRFHKIDPRSGRYGYDKNWSLWGSWAVVGQSGGKFWFGGDTAYCDVFAQVPIVAFSFWRHFVFVDFSFWRPFCC
jgi:L-ascorbate metabolism protein UlaG (beta-lactamase superfamily)